MRNVDTFYPEVILDKKYKSPYGKTFRDYRNQLELSDKQIQFIISHCKKIKIKPFFFYFRYSKLYKVEKI